MPSTRDLSTLPDVEEFRRLCQSLAMLDAILCPEWEYRYYSFNSKWAPGEEMASMRDGCGDGYFTVFSKAGAILKGFSLRSEAWRSILRQGRSWPAVFDGVPEEFASFLEEPAFSIEEATFCLWRRSSDPAWQAGSIGPLEGKDPDGSAELMPLLDGNPKAYQEWAEDHFETLVALSAVESIFGHTPLTEHVVKLLNPDLSLEELADDLAEIGYPAPS